MITYFKRYLTDQEFLQVHIRTIFISDISINNPLCLAKLNFLIAAQIADGSIWLQHQCTHTSLPKINI